MRSSLWSRMDRRIARRLLSVAGLVFYSLAAFALVYSGAGLGLFFATTGTKADLLLPACCLLLAGCHFVVGYHLRRRRVWARNFAFAFALVSLVVIPVGTVLGILVIFCIDAANRAGLFPLRRRSPSAEEAPREEEPALVLTFEPDLAAEQAG